MTTHLWHYFQWNGPIHGLLSARRRSRRSTFRILLQSRFYSFDIPPAFSRILSRAEQSSSRQVFLLLFFFFFWKLTARNYSRGISGTRTLLQLYNFPTYARSFWNVTLNCELCISRIICKSLQDIRNVSL